MANKLIHLTLIILITATLRLPDLSILPKWDWDEGVHFNIAHNLQEGRSEWFSIRYYWVPHPPLYYIAAGAFMNATSNNIASMRLLSVIYALATATLIYYITCELMDETAGLLAGIFFALHPAAAYWGRTALITNQLMALMALSTYLLLLYSRRRDRRILHLTCLTIGLATLTEYFAVAAAAAAIISILWHDRKRTIEVAALTTIVPLLFILYMYSTNQTQYTADTLFQLTRFKPLSNPAMAAATGFILTASLPLLILYSEKIRTLLHDTLSIKSRKASFALLMFYLPFTTLIFLIPPTEQSFMTALSFQWIASTFGLVFINRLEHKSIIWLTYITYLIILLGSARGDHIVMPLYPIWAAGLGIITAKFWQNRHEYANILAPYFGPSAALITSALILLPLPALLIQDYAAFYGGGLKKMPLEKVGEVNSIVNSLVKPTDLVITYSYFAPYIKAHTTTFSESIAYSGRGIGTYYRPSIPPERFTWNISIQNAKIIVIPKGLVSDLDQLGYGEFADQIRALKLIHEVNNSGYGPDYQIYENVNL